MSTAAAEEKKPDGEEAENQLPPLPPWQPTVLARYPRWLKIVVTLGSLILILSPALIKIPKSLHGNIKAITRIERAQSKKTSLDEKGPDSAAEDININNPASDVSNGIINQPDDPTVKLSGAPDVGLSEDTPEGSLPRIGEDGRQPWQVYARPFNTADHRPRIAIVIVDMGLSRDMTDAAINRLPGSVTLAFDVQSPVVGAWCARARQAGHETLLSVPMEPFDYPRSDPGANTLLTALPNIDNTTRLNWALRQSTGYVGITTLSGSRFTTDPTKLATVLDIVKKRGLMIFDARIAPHSAVFDMARSAQIPVAASTLRLDLNPVPEAIDQALDQLEKTARLTGRAVGIASPLPVVTDRLENWSKNLTDHGIALAPISAMVK